MIQLKFTKAQCHYLEHFIRQRVNVLLDVYLILHKALTDAKEQPDTHVLAFQLSVDDIFKVMEQIGGREEKLYAEINRNIKAAVLAEVDVKVHNAVMAVTAYQQAMQEYTQAQATSTEEVPLPTVPPPTLEQITYAQFSQKFQEWEATINGNLEQEINQSKARF